MLEPPEIDMRTVRDIYTPPAPGTLMRMVSLHKSGLYRLARRSSELYSVLIVGQGAWAKARIMTGTGRPVWEMPSAFSGSFLLLGYCEEGIIAHLHAFEQGDSLNFSVQFREPDAKLV
jgi:hypothetical protein